MSRLTNRIAKLEAGASQQSAEQTKMLVEVLARRDAICWPRRDRHNLGFPHVVARRRDDRAGKYGVSAKSSGRGQWGETMDLRNALIAQGLCTPTRSQGGEISGLRITPTGETTVRALLRPHLFTLNDALPKLVFAYMQLRQATTKGLMWEGLLWQRTLSGRAADWEHLTEPMLPLLTAGLVESTFDTVGRVYFRLTDEPYPETSTREREPDSELFDVYLAAFKSETDMLSKLEPDAEIHIPLPATIGLHEYHPDDHDPEFAEKRESIEKLEAVLGSYGLFVPSKSTEPNKPESEADNAQEK